MLPSRHDFNVFGRNAIGPLSCLSCPVCNVRALCPNGWTDQDETWREVGLGPGHIVLGGDPAPLS